MIKEILLKELCDYANSVGLNCIVDGDRLYLSEKDWYICSMIYNNVCWPTIYKYSDAFYFNLTDPNIVTKLKEVIKGYASIK